MAGRMSASRLLGYRPFGFQRIVALASAVCCLFAQFGFASSTAAASQRKIYFYHPDHLGSTNLVTDEQGQVVQVLQYTPYGSVASNTGTVDLPHKFTGQRVDASTGLYYYKARYYDPKFGRFIQPDSVVPSAGDPQALNRYSYVRNNPVKYTDVMLPIFQAGAKRV